MPITYLKLLVRLWKHERHDEIESSLKHTTTQRRGKVTVQFIQAALIVSLIRQSLFATLFLTRKVLLRDRHSIVHLVHIDANALRAVLFASSLQSIASERGPDGEHNGITLPPRTSVTFVAQTRASMPFALAESGTKLQWATFPALPSTLNTYTAFPSFFPCKTTFCSILNRQRGQWKTFVQIEKKLGIVPLRSRLHPRHRRTILLHCFL